MRRLHASRSINALIFQRRCLRFQGLGDEAECGRKLLWTCVNRLVEWRLGGRRRKVARVGEIKRTRSFREKREIEVRTLVERFANSGRKFSQVLASIP